MLRHIKPTPHICKEDICSRTLKRVWKQVTDLSPRGRGETENPGDPDDEQDRNDEQGSSASRLMRSEGTDRSE